MSMAPRPHTSPSISSPPKGSWDQSVAVGRHHVGVPEQGEGRCRRVACRRAWPPARSGPGCGLVGLHFHARPLEVVLEEVGAALLLARARRAVVDAAVPDQVLEEVGGLVGPLVSVVTCSILRSPGRDGPAGRPSSGRDAPAAGRTIVGGAGRWLTGPTYGILNSRPPAHRRRRLQSATEGRTLPSLAQLNEAIETFLEEYRGFNAEDVTVVVDASFGHRIDPSEVEGFEQAIEHGEMVTPAGRGRRTW